MSPKPLEIRKEAFIQAREKLGLSTKELGGMACLSTRQIEQIENGETSSFYGAQIKLTAAKKVARLLQLSDEDAFDNSAQAPQKLQETQAELPIAEAKLVKNPQDGEVKKQSAKKGAAAKDVVEIKEQVEETQLPPKVITEKKEPITTVQAKEALLTAELSKPKPTSQKKLFLWLSVLAGLVFAVINLRPLLFEDKPEEIVVVKEEIIAPAPPLATTPAEPAPAVVPITVAPIATAPVVATPASVIASGASGVCPAEEGVMSYRPEVARKPADMVYVQTKSQQVICVIDASGKTQNKLLEPGAGTSFYGRPPFKVLTTGLNQVDVFFQGSKVRLTNPSIKTVILEASEIVTAPTDRTDSQLR